jgi:acetyltransferase-like isoleucine patch superfamily enzyme
VLTAGHVVGGHDQRAAESLPEPVTIGAGCWLAAGAIILPGVTVGDGCVIGAGAVVVEDCAPDGLYGGVPARRLRDFGPTSPEPLATVHSRA